MREAFETINRQAEQKAGAFEYIVLLVDNLDQRPPAEQQRIIQEIHSWIEEHPKLFWRVILTMWPATYKDLAASDVALLRSSTRFTIGPLTANCHAERANALSLAIAGQALEIQGYVDDRIQEYISFAFTAIDRSMLELVRGLTYGDLRRELRIVSEYLCSEDCFRCWQDGKASHHDLMRGLLLGRKDAFDHDVSRIANVLLLGHAVERPRDMLVGWHLLETIQQARTLKSVYSNMLTMGYREENISRALDNAWRLNLFHRTTTKKDLYADEEFVIHQSVLDRYRQLVAQPAYVECIAVTTPITESVAKRMEAVVADSKGDGFAARVGCTIEFIRGVRQDEEQFVNIAADRRDINAEEFATFLRKHKVHKLWVRMAQRYLARLTGLRKSGTLPTVKEAQWKQWLESDVLTDFRQQEEFVSL